MSIHVIRHANNFAMITVLGHVPLVVAKDARILVRLTAIVVVPLNLDLKAVAVVLILAAPTVLVEVAVIFVERIIMAHATITVV